MAVDPSILAATAAAPALERRAEQLASKLWEVSREELTTIGIDENLDVVPKGEGVFDWKVTPGGIGATVAGIIACWLAYRSWKEGWRWDPFGLKNIGLGASITDLPAAASTAVNNALGSLPGLGIGRGGLIQIARQILRWPF